jgi:hypothetical protein
MEVLEIFTFISDGKKLFCDELNFTIDIKDVFDCVANDRHVFILIDKMLCCFDLMGNLVYSMETPYKGGHIRYRMFLIDDYPVVFCPNTNIIRLYDGANIFVLKLNGRVNNVINLNGDIIALQAEPYRNDKVEFVDDNKLILSPLDDPRFSFNYPYVVFSDHLYLEYSSNRIIALAPDRGDDIACMQYYYVVYITDDLVYTRWKGLLVKILIADFENIPGAPVKKICNITGDFDGYCHFIIKHSKYLVNFSD